MTTQQTIDESKLLEFVVHGIGHEANSFFMSFRRVAETPFNRVCEARV